MGARISKNYLAQVNYLLYSHIAPSSCTETNTDGVASSTLIVISFIGALGFIQISNAECNEYYYPPAHGGCPGVCNENTYTWKSTKQAACAQNAENLVISIQGYLARGATPEWIFSDISSSFDPS